MVMLNNVMGCVEKQGVSDGYERTKRPRMMESNPYFPVNSSGAFDGFDVVPKRPRMMEPSPYFGMSRTSIFEQNYYGGGSSNVYNFPVVRLRGLPFNCEELDIYKFFSGLDIVDCLLVNKNGRFSGEAFVVFPTHLQAEFALQRDRHNMGRRYVEVFTGKKVDYYHAVAAEVSQGGPLFDEYYHTSPPPRPKKSADDRHNLEFTEVLKLRGLPYHVSKTEIVEFFGDGFRISEDNVCIALRADGKATGEAFVEFESVDMAKIAMSKDKMTIGSRYVELFPATKELFKRAQSRSKQ